MPENTYKKDLSGVEDISFDTNRNNEQFNRDTSTGGSQSITKINARHIPVSNALELLGAESVEDFLSKIITILNVDGGQSEDPLVTADNAFVDGNLVVADGDVRKLKDAEVSLDDVITIAGCNKIIDPQLITWDDGAGPFITNGGYTAIMWKQTFSGMSSPQVMRGVNTTSSKSQFYAQLTGGVIDTLNGFHNLSQVRYLDNFQEFLGGKVTVKIKLKGSVTGVIGVRLKGTGLTEVAAEIPVTTSYTEQIVTLDLSSKAQVFNTDTMEVFVDRYIGTSFSHGYVTNPTYVGALDIDEITLVGGEVPFNGSWPTSVDVKNGIDPYYESSYNLGILPGTPSANGRTIYESLGQFEPVYGIRFRAYKITEPTVNIYSTATGAVNNMRDLNAGTDLPSGFTEVGNTGITIFPTGATPALGNNLSFQYIADARL